MIHIESDYKDIDAEINRITQRMPDAKTRALLDGALAEAFALTQAVVHVKTGRLKASGAESSGKSHVRNRWEGTITYGGSGGSGVLVDYAIYEKQRDGAHDFFGPLPFAHPFFVAAMRAGLAGNHG